MALVEFLRISCQNTQERLSDEPYLLYNGELLMSEKSDVDEGESRAIDVIKRFEGAARVELYEADGPFDGDDFLASVTILESEAGQGQRFQEMNGDGAAYTLFYQVFG
jgi:hypothetical protein